MLIDTHVHYNLPPLSEEWQKHWQTAQDKGIGKSIIVGTTVETTELAAKQAGTDKNLSFSVGIHPITVDNHTTLKKVSAQITLLGNFVTHKKAVAIGECGLDYYRIPEDGEARESNIQHQKHLFISQLELALEADLPVILHVRDKKAPEQTTRGNAYWDALEIVQEYELQKFVLHCVSGPKNYVKAAVKMGGYMGFDGNITYPNAGEIRHLFKLVPTNRRLLETDAPYLPPQEFRGKICQPWMIGETAKYIEKELEMDPKQFTENAERLFEI